MRKNKLDMQKHCNGTWCQYRNWTYNYDDGYMKLNVDVNAKSIDLEEYASKQKKSIADMCNVPEEKVIPISRLEYETYADE